MIIAVIVKPMDRFTALLRMDGIKHLSFVVGAMCMSTPAKRFVHTSVPQFGQLINLYLDIYTSCFRLASRIETLITFHN